MTRALARIAAAIAGPRPSTNARRALSEKATLGVTGQVPGDGARCTERLLGGYQYVGRYGRAVRIPGETGPVAVGRQAAADREAGCRAEPWRGGAGRRPDAEIPLRQGADERPQREMAAACRVAVSRVALGNTTVRLAL
jgi:hypothetical protein